MSPSAIDTEEIRSASTSDPELQLVRKCITENTLYKLPSAFKAISSEVCVANDIVLRIIRIVLPKALRSQAMKVAHEDHARVTRSGGSSVSQNKLPQLILGYIYILKYLQNNFIG